MAVAFDVVVIGGGMVGALAANLLLQQDLRVALVDRSSGQITLSTAPSYDSRVSAISIHSQALFERAGVWGEINTERLTPYYHMQVWDGLGTGNIEFSCDDVHLDVLGHLVENDVLSQGLLNQLSQYSSDFSSYFSASVVDIAQKQESVTVVLESGETIEAATLVAADGANSFVRELVGIKTKEWDYNHHAIVSTLEVDRSHENTAWQSFGDEGVLAFLPMPSYNGRHFVSIVWSVLPVDASALLELDEHAFCQRVQYAISSKFKVVSLQSKRIAIPLRQRHATHYVQNGIALIGDAAHTIHPLAGQGANLGFADAGALAIVLGKAKKRGESLTDERVLRRYQRLRMADNMRMAAAMEMFKRLYDKQTPAQVLARNVGMTFVNKQQWLKNNIVQLAIGAQ